MTKRLDNLSTYKVDGELGSYLVTLEHLKNDRNGNGRFKANIITIPNSGTNSNYYFTRVYTFTTHYYGDLGEAEWVVKRMEFDIKVANAKAKKEGE
jgi:hypothetical protein